MSVLARASLASADWPRGAYHVHWTMTAAAELSLVLIFAAGTLDAAEIKFLSANGAKFIVADLVAAFERKTNDKATISYGEAGELRKRIQEGEAFDAVVLPAIELLLPSGKISSDSVVKIAHSDLGIGMRNGAPKPDTSMAHADAAGYRDAGRSLACHFEQGA